MLTKNLLLSPITVLFILIFLSSPYLGKTQNISALATQYNDSFIAWWIYGIDDDEPIGELRMKSPTREDWTSWVYEFYDGSYGNIKVLWQDDLTQWQVFGEGSVVSFRQKWNNDATHWRIETDEDVISFKSRYSNILEEWSCEDQELGTYEVYTTYEGDPRDWTVVDQTSHQLDLTTRMGMIFIALFNGSPRL